MDPQLFWFDGGQWAKIEPHLPKVQPGPQRKDDRRFVSGISAQSRLPLGRLPAGIRPLQNDLQSLRPLE
jgi:hypothetical protein